ncbi:MAG: hypothetical protein U1F43_36550 [Myxococcota bacterium]
MTAGILARDLKAVSEQGKAAAHADEQQRAALTRGTVAVTLRREDIETAFAAEDALRQKLPAVVADLQAGGEKGLGLFLARLSFARFRIREIKPPKDAPATTPAEEETLKQVERVEREDQPTRLLGLAAFLDAVLADDAGPIRAALAERQTSAEALTALRDTARALGNQGRNIQAPTDWTRKESDAVDAANAAWRSIRRMVRSAVRGDAALEALLARC